MRRRAFLGAGAALGVGLGVGLALPKRLRADASLVPVRFAVNFTYQGIHAMWGLALQRGLFAAEGLDVLMNRGYGSGDTILKVASGAYDIGFADVNGIIKFNTEQPDKRLIDVLQCFDRTLSAIITLDKSGIRTPKDLESRTVAAPPDDATTLLFPAFARVNHVDRSRVRWRNIAPNVRETLLARGDVDAIGGFTSTSLFNLLAVGVPRERIVLIPFASWGLDLYGNALVVRQDYAAKHPDVVRRFVRGTIAGTQALLRDPQAGMAAMKARDPLFDTALELQRWELVCDEAYLTPAVRQNGFGTVDPARMQATITANAEAYGIAKPPPLTDIYTTAYLPPKEERIPAT